MFESSSKNRKSWNGRQMVWHRFCYENPLKSEEKFSKFVLLF